MIYSAAQSFKIIRSFCTEVGEADLNASVRYWIRNNYQLARTRKSIDLHISLSRNLSPSSTPPTAARARSVSNKGLLRLFKP